MSTPSYEVLSFNDFGRQLLKTGDLDPVYYCLDRVAGDVDHSVLCRLVLAYWCFYHLGTAAWIASAKTRAEYWTRMQVAAENVGEPKPWPRGAERRHFRGAQAVSAISELARDFKDATDVMNHIFPRSPIPFSEVTRNAQTLRGFGDWISFKIADMGERVLRLQVDFADCHLGFYKDPRQGAVFAWLALDEPVENGLLHPSELGDRPWEYSLSDEEFKRIVDKTISHFRKAPYKAPPHRDRSVNVQEIETIMCKYKSHFKGHYPLLKDTHEVREALSAPKFAALPLVELMLEGLPRG